MIDKKISIEFGIRLKQARKAKGHKNRNELSGLLGIHPGTYGLYEIGKRAPDALIIRNICNILQINYTWLFTGDGPMTLSSNGNKIGIDTDLLAEILEKLESILNNEQAVLSPLKKAEITSILYDNALENQNLQEFEIDRATKCFIKLLADEKQAAPGKNETKKQKN